MYKLRYKYREDYQNLVLIKYSQLGSDFKVHLANESNSLAVLAHPQYPLVQECRGIILDDERDWAVVAMPYAKFFNFNEPHAHTIDWSTATVCEKADGSLMTLYWYKDSWHVSSSGIPDASGKYASH